MENFDIKLYRSYEDEKIVITFEPSFDNYLIDVYLKDNNAIRYNVLRHRKIDLQKENFSLINDKIYAFICRKLALWEYEEYLAKNKDINIITTLVESF